MKAANCYGINCDVLDLFCKANVANDVSMVTLRPTRPSPVLCRPRDEPESASPQVTIRLPTRSVWAAPTSTRTVRCLTGKIWITQEGDSRDHVLSTGQSFTSTRAGKIVVQAMDESTIRV
jgi:hypothetical protein